MMKSEREVLERAITMLKATEDFVEGNPISEYTVFYDDANCDGGCLSNDCLTLRLQIEEMLKTGASVIDGGKR